MRHDLHYRPLAVLRRAGLSLALAGALLGAAGGVAPLTVASATPLRGVPTVADPDSVPCEISSTYLNPRTEFITHEGDLERWMDACEGFWISPVPT